MNSNVANDTGKLSNAIQINMWEGKLVRKSVLSPEKYVQLTDCSRLCVH